MEDSVHCVVVHLLLALKVDTGADRQTVTMEEELFGLEIGIELIHRYFVVVAGNTCQHVSVTLVTTGV